MTFETAGRGCLWRSDVYNWVSHVSRSPTKLGVAAPRSALAADCPSDDVALVTYACPRRGGHPWPISQRWRVTSACSGRSIRKREPQQPILHPCLRQKSRRAARNRLIECPGTGRVDAGGGLARDILPSDRPRIYLDLGWEAGSIGGARARTKRSKSKPIQRRPRQLSPARPGIVNQAQGGVEYRRALVWRSRHPAHLIRPHWPRPLPHGRAARHELTPRPASAPAICG
jgi:hypothetical protein